MVRNTDKRAETKAVEMQELEVQLSKGFYCGSCNYGFTTIEVWQKLDLPLVLIAITKYY